MTLVLIGEDLLWMVKKTQHEGHSWIKWRDFASQRSKIFQRESKIIHLAAFRLHWNILHDDGCRSIAAEVRMWSWRTSHQVGVELTWEAANQKPLWLFIKFHNFFWTFGSFEQFYGLVLKVLCMQQSLNRLKRRRPQPPAFNILPRRLWKAKSCE